MTRTITFAAATAAIALVVAAPGFGKGQPVVTDPATEAQILRGEALGRYYERAAVGVDPATEAQILRGAALDRHFGIGRFAVDPATEAQILRGEAMDRHYALGRFASSIERGTEAGFESSPVSVTSGNELDWAQLVLGLGLGVLLASGLLVAVRLTRTRPVGH